MQVCDISITTIADGEKTSFACSGEMDASLQNTRIFYQEENASVAVFFEKETAMVVREGDYTLTLPLKRGERTTGKLGIGGNEGDVELFAYKIEYSLRENSVFALLHYDLLLGGGKQEMKLRIVAKARKEENV